MSRRPRGKRVGLWRGLTLTGLLALALQACSVVVIPKPPDRVSMKAYPLDLVYGPEPVPVVPSGLFAGGIFEEPEVIDISFGFSSRPVVVTDPCPAPGADVFPAEPAALDVTKKITPGLYTYKQSGELEIVGLAKAPLGGLARRSIRNLQTAPDESFTFEYHLTIGLFLRQVQYLQVRPADGAYLTRIQTFYANSTLEFRPLLPVEVFPLPVTVGPPFQSFGLDVSTGETLSVTGRVTGRERVEGCNEVVDAWGVDGAWAFQRPNETQPRIWDYDYSIAPHLGGLQASDKLVTTLIIGGFTFKINVSSALGKSQPEPELGY